VLINLRVGQFQNQGRARPGLSQSLAKLLQLLQLLLLLLRLLLLVLLHLPRLALRWVSADPS
jgi:hypothetical protein